MVNLSNVQVPQIGIVDARMLLYSGLPLSRQGRQNKAVNLNPSIFDSLLKSGQILGFEKTSVEFLPAPLTGMGLSTSIEWQNNFMEYVPHREYADYDSIDGIQLAHLTWRADIENWFKQRAERPDKYLRKLDEFDDADKATQSSIDVAADELKKLQEQRKKTKDKKERTKLNKKIKIRRLQIRKLQKKLGTTLGGTGPVWRMETQNFPRQTNAAVSAKEKEKAKSDDSNKEEEANKNKIDITVPTQVRVGGDNDSPEILENGLHWGLRKSVSLFDRQGVVLEFIHDNEPKAPNTDKELDPSSTLFPFLHIKREKTLEVEQTKTAGTENNSSATTAEKDNTIKEIPAVIEANLHKSAYHIIHLNNCGRDSDEDYFIVISSTEKPKFIVRSRASSYSKITKPDYVEREKTRVKNSVDYSETTKMTRFMEEDLVTDSSGDNYVKVVSTYEQGSGIDWLKAPRLRLIIENIGSYIVIYNNLNPAPWIISHTQQYVTSKFQLDTSNTEQKSGSERNLIEKDRVVEGMLRHLVLKGKMTIYGGNMTTGIAYTPLRYLNNYVNMDFKFTYNRYENLEDEAPYLNATLRHKGDNGTPSDDESVNYKGSFAVTTDILEGETSDESFRRNRGSDGDLRKAEGNDDTKIIFEEVSSSQIDERRAFALYRLHLYAADALDETERYKEIYDGKAVGTNSLDDPLASIVPGVTLEYDEELPVIRRARSPFVYTIYTDVDPHPIWAPVEAFDVTADLAEVQNTWSASNYQEIRHTLEVTLFNKKTDLDEDGLKTTLYFSQEDIQKDGHVAVVPPKSAGTRKDVDYRIFLKRNTFVRFLIKWKDGAGSDGDLSGATDPTAPDEGNDPRTLSFTGVCYGGDVSTRAEQEVVKLECEDMMRVLDDVPILNSPFYDGMEANAAVLDLAQKASLNYDPEGKNNQIRVTAGTPEDKYKQTGEFDSNNLNKFILPMGYSFLEPKMKFPDRQSIKECILQIAKMDWRIMYFDEFGVFYYANLPGGNEGKVSESDVKAEFYSSPHDISDTDPTDGRNAISNDKLIFVVYREKRESWNMGDVRSSIQVMSVDKESRDIILQRQTNWNGMEPSTSLSDASIGYVGYNKPYIARAPYLGDRNVTRKYMRNLTRLYRPPYHVSFEIYGLVNLKALDIIKIDGKYARITNIQNTINKKENQYWSQITAEWFEPEQSKDEAAPAS